MNDPDSIFENLNNIGRIEAIKMLHNLYSVSDDKKTRIRILETLNKLQDDTHFDEIENYFISDEDSEVRIEAAKLLAFNYSKNRAIKPLIWVLENEKKSEVRFTALRLLVPLAKRQEFSELIIETLKKTLFNENDRLKMEAAESLGFLKENSAVDQLVELLKSSNKLVRISAIQALNNLKSPKATNRLIENLGLDSSDVWDHAFRALKNMIEIEELTDLLLKYLEFTEKEDNVLEKGYLRRGIIKALGELRNKKAIPLLINALKDWYDWVRQEAIEALDKIEPHWREKYRIDLKRKRINLKE